MINPMIHPHPFTNRKPRSVGGLRSYTTEEIEELVKNKQPCYHRTHNNDGSALPFNGIIVYF